MRFLCVIAVFWVMAYSVMSCRGKDPISDPGTRLQFSVDTLRFDTIFTTRRSATRLMKVYNPYKQPILIEQIGIEFDDLPFMTTEEQKVAIQHANLQVKNGEIIDEDQAYNQIDEWLNE